MRLMQVAVTNVVAEYVGPLLDAFTTRDSGIDVQIESVPGASIADLLDHRRVDIALGPAPAPERVNTIATVPFLRCRLIVAAAPGHPLAGQRDVAPGQLAGERWLLGPPDLDPTTGAGLLFARTGIEPDDLIAYTSHAAAIAAAAAGDGIVVTLPTPCSRSCVAGRSCASTSAEHRCSSCGTPRRSASGARCRRSGDAALRHELGGHPGDLHRASGHELARARPRPHVTLWRSVADELRAGGA